MVMARAAETKDNFMISPKYNNEIEHPRPTKVMDGFSEQSFGVVYKSGLCRKMK
jgi:hypothetical protein